MKPLFKSHYGKLPEWDGLPESAREYLSYCLRHLTVHPLRCYSYSNFKKWSLPLRRRENPYFMLFEKGSGLLRIGENAERLKGGELIVFATGVEHSFTPDPGTTSETTNLHFQALVNGAVDFVGHLGLSGVYRNCRWVSREVFFELSTVHSVAPPGKNEFMEAQIRLMLWRLAPKASPISQNLIGRLRLQPALRLIERELENSQLSLSKMASAMNLSPIRFRQLLHEHFGLSPLQFLQKARIERAKTLLFTTDKSVKEISGLCGFSDLNFFHRIFRRLTGVTPAFLRVTTRH